MQLISQRWRLPSLGVLALTPLLVGIIICIYSGYQRSTLAQPYRYPFTDISSNSGIRALKNEIAFYKQRIDKNTTDGLDRAALANVYLKMTRATGDENWYPLAEQAAQQSLANLPLNNQGAQLVLARVAEARHQFQDTIDRSQAVLQSQPGNEEALAMLVTANLAKGQLKAASQAANQLVEQTPTLGAFTLRALVHEARGQDQLAVQDFQRALAVEEPGERGSSAWVRTLFGRFQTSRGKLTLAQDLYEEALRILPRYPLVMVELAELEMKQGKYEAAAARFAQISSSSDSAHVLDHEALAGMAQVKALQGDRVAAEKLWDQAEHLFRHHEDLESFGHRRELAHLLLARGREEDIPEALELMQAEVTTRRDAETLETYAWALSQAQRWQEARQILQEAIDLGTRNAELFHRAAMVEKQLGNRKRAIAYFQQAQEVDPTFNPNA